MHDRFYVDRAVPPTCSNFRPRKTPGTWPICSRRLSAAVDANQFIVAPERAIEQQHVSGLQVLSSAHRRSVEPPASRQDVFPTTFRRSGPVMLLRDSVATGAAAKRTRESVCPAKVHGNAIRNLRPTGLCQWRIQFSGAKAGPGHLPGNALQHAEHRVVLGNNPAHRIGRVHAQRLQLAQQQQSENVVNIGIRQDGPGDRGLTNALARMKFRVRPRFARADRARLRAETTSGFRRHSQSRR